MALSENDPLFLDIYNHTWRDISPALRDRLRTGTEDLAAGEVAELLKAPHPLVTLTEWIDQPESKAWNIAPAFAAWAATRAPSETDLATSER